MRKTSLSKNELHAIERAVNHFEQNRGIVEAFAKSLVIQFEHHPRLSQQIHFLKYRVKDAAHLQQKLIRKQSEAKIRNEMVPIDESNVFELVNDLAGIRILHLHTDQIKVIHESLLEIVEESKLRLVEDPIANCWDIEYAKLYEDLGIKSRSRDSMYTTVHYVVEANQRTKLTCEIQVRTLMDEVWGEVSHSVNYPIESPSSVCKDQLKVLARFTSGCTRLVDSIFKSQGFENSEPLSPQT